MPLSIDQISRNLGIEDVPIYDHEKATEEKDTRKLTQGGKDSAGPDARIGARGPGAIESSEERNKRRAVEAGLAPAPTSTSTPSSSTSTEGFTKRVLAAEAHASDVKTGMYSMYYEPSTGTRNVGPGLNLEDPATWGLLEKEGLDINWFHQNSPHESDGLDVRNRIQDPEVQKKLENVFAKRVKMAENDAITYVGGKTKWGKLSDTQRSAFSEMSYNLGLSKLSKFKEMKKGIDALVSLKSKKGPVDEAKERELIDLIAFEALNSKWANQDVPSRAIRLVAELMIGGQDDANYMDYRKV